MLSDQQKPVIVLAFANDRSDQAHHPRNLPDELRRIADRLQIAEKAGLCEVVVRTGSTVNELLDVFQDRQYKNRIAVFHFSGHAGAFQLLVDAVNESPEHIHSDDLIEFIGQQDGLQLVFLNGCATISHAEGLIEASVPAVIATAESIEDDLALELSSHFYAELAGGASIHTAYQEAVVGAKKIHDARPSNHTTQNGPIELSTRDFILPNSTSPDQWPWDLYLGEGSEFVKTWNLPAAFEDSLLGLPDLIQQDLPTNPYRHLHWFREEEAELFFGRDREIRALFEMVTSAYAEPIVLFYGHTGVGKSSILASGLLPRINQTHESFYIRQQIELGLTGTLAHGLNILNPSEATAEIIKVAWLWHETKNKKPLVVVLDQVEEIFTRLNPEQLAIYLKEFLDVLNHLFMGNEEKPAGKLVLSFRKEWLPDIETACKEAECHFSKFLLKRLDKNGLMEAIEGVSRSERLKNHYGLNIEDGLSALIADDFLEDVASPVAPALQLLLTKMWQAARLKNVHEPEFTADIYHTLKQNGVLPGDFLNEQLDNIHQRYPEISNSGFVLDVLARHTTTRGTAATCTIEVLMDIYDHEKKRLPMLLKEFKELHLIEPVEQQVNGLADQATRLAHDILAPLIQQLYRDSDRPGQRARRILESYVPEWDQGQIGATLDEADLQRVDAGKSGMHNWTNNEQRLILASRRARAKRKRVRNRIRMGVVTAVALITAFGFYVSKQQGLTEESRDEQSATQTEIAKQEALDAQALAEQQLAEARHLQLLAEANVAEARRQESLAIEQETIQQQIPAQNAQRTDEQSAIAADRIASDRTAANRTVTDRTVANRTATDRTVANRTVAVNLQRRRPLGLALSSKALLRLGKNDNQTAALLAREAFQFNKEGNGIFVNEVYDALRRTLNAVDQDNGGPFTIHPSHEDWVRTVGYSPSDEWTLSAGDDGHAYLRSQKARTDEAIVLPAHRHNVVRELRVNPNNSLIATVGNDHQLRIWENQHREFEEIYTFDMQEESVRGLAFQPEGNHIALATEDHVLYILPVRGDVSQAPISISTDGYVVRSLSFSADGKWLVAGDNSGYIHVWSWNNLAGNPVIVQAHRGAVRTVAFSSNFLVSGGEDTRVGLWKINAQGTPKLIEFLRGHNGPINTAAFSPDGTQLATGSADQTVRLWNVERAGVEPPIILKDHSSWIESVRFSADSRSLVSSSADGTTRIWRIDLEELASDICKAVPNNLKETEWKFYTGEGIDYPDSCKSTDFAQTTTTTH